MGRKVQTKQGSSGDGQSCRGTWRTGTMTLSGETGTWRGLVGVLLEALVSSVVCRRNLRRRSAVKAAPRWCSLLMATEAGGNAPSRERSDDELLGRRGHGAGWGGWFPSI